MFVQADVTSEAGGARGGSERAADGRSRISVNCAGIGWAQRTVSRDGSPHALEAFKTVISVNLIGTFNVLRLSAAAMSSLDPSGTGERGVIVNTASVAAFDGQIGQAAYAAKQGGHRGDDAAGGAGSVTRRDSGRDHRAGAFLTRRLLATLPEKARQALQSNIPFPGRPGHVDEFATMVESVVINPYLNGETIRLDGALRMAPR